MKLNNISFDSMCIHDKNNLAKSHQLPIYATSSFEFESLDEGIDIFTGKKEGHLYGRYGNPTIDEVASKIASLESYGLDIESFGIMTSSGMSAIATTCMSLCKAGDTVLTQRDLYGGSSELLLKVLSKCGIKSTFCNVRDYEYVDSILKDDPSIKMIYIETPSNPTLRCIDLQAISTIAKMYNINTVVDNTFCTPYLQQPLQFGIDYVVHSTTKFLNGHGNGISGIIVGRDIKNKEIINKTMKLLGTNCNPFDAWLVNNGIKTLPLRMDKQSHNANLLADYLESHNKVAHVNYLSLQSHPDHLIAKSQMRNYGAMLSFEISGGISTAKRFMDGLKLCTIAPTLGDVDSLIVHPASMSHMNVERSIREENGITDGLIRVSVGIENIKDIIADIENALQIDIPSVA